MKYLAMIACLVLVYQTVIWWYTTSQLMDIQMQLFAMRLKFTGKIAVTHDAKEPKPEVSGPDEGAGAGFTWQ